MKIVRCSRCGRLIHMDAACMFCGCSGENAVVSEAAVHENAAMQFAVAETLVTQGRFAEAEKSLAEVMKWSATSSEVHWLRLLVRAGCRSDRELFFKGTDIAASPDYETALRYASEEEKQVYSAVEKASAALKDALVKMVTARNTKITADMHPEEKLQLMKQIVSEKSVSLLSAWQELRKCEQEMKKLENEGLFFIHESRSSMESLRNSAMELRSSLDNTDELARKEFFMYKTKLESMKKNAETAREEYYRLKEQHPAVAAFAQLSEKRSAIKAEIDRGLAELRQHEKAIEDFIADMSAKQNSSNALLEMAENGNYGQVKAALGQNNFDNAVRYALSIK